MMRRLAALLALLFLSHAVFAVPLGYRYVGSRIVSEGRHVYWYWNPDYFQLDGSGGGFVAQMHARNLELNQERAFVAIIRCDSRTYRRADSKDPFDRIEEGDPVYEVWRAGCDGTRAASLPERIARMDGTSGARGAAPPPVPTAATARAPAQAPPVAPAATASPAPAAAAPPPDRRGDDRRVDSCIRFAEKSVSQFGDATITNTCKFAVEVAYCYKGGRGGAFDCPSPPRMKRVDSLDAGATRNLLEYKRGSNSGVALVACKGAMGSVTPVLNGDGGKSGCN
jgi:hypothetical protein